VKTSRRPSSLVTGRGGDERALGLLEKAVHPGVQIEGLCGPAELRETRLDELVPRFAAVGTFSAVTRAAD
jgi:hypothetical protein